MLFANSILAAGDVAAGKTKVMMCMGCHGADGNSMVPSFPKLAGLGEKYITTQLRNIKSGDRVIMEMMGILDMSSDQDLQDMAAFYDSQQRSIAGAKEIELIGISDPQQAIDYGCKHPAIHAPFKGWISLYSSRRLIKPGISASASSISLRPQSARDMSFTL